MSQPDVNTILKHVSERAVKTVLGVAASGIKLNTKKSFVELITLNFS